jgi:hypothetical protein
MDVAYLTSTKFLPEELDRIIRSAGPSEKRWLTLALDLETAERLRAAFTSRLARVGFDGEYEPTREGRLLEDLIDRFAWGGSL